MEVLECEGCSAEFTEAGTLTELNGKDLCDVCFELTCGECKQVVDVVVTYGSISLCESCDEVIGERYLEDLVADMDEFWDREFDVDLDTGQVVLKDM